MYHFLSLIPDIKTVRVAFKLLRVGKEVGLELPTVLVAEQLSFCTATYGLSLCHRHKV